MSQALLGLGYTRKMWKQNSAVGGYIQVQEAY